VALVQNTNATMPENESQKPAKAPKTRIKLRARVVETNAAPGGDLTKLKKAYQVQVLKSRKWEKYATFETHDQAANQAEALDGLEVDIS